MTVKLKFKKNSFSINRAISGLISREEDDYFGFFPFCLFDKNYYSYLKRKKQSPYYGEIVNKEFNLYKYISYGGTSGRRSRIFRLKGNIEERNNQESEVKVFLELSYVMFVFICLIPVLLFFAWYYKFHYLDFLFILIIMFFHEVYIILINIYRLKKRIKNYVP